MVAHLAHDRAALQDLLGLLANKQLVLIDTTGVAPRDPRKDEILDLLDLPGVQKLLAVNAAGQGESLDDVMQAFKARGSNQAVLTKVDEAVKLGPSVDTLIRHQMQLRGVTNGQRVPEDWERADAQQLVSTSMRAPARSAFDPKCMDLNRDEQKALKDSKKQLLYFYFRCDSVSINSIKELHKLISELNERYAQFNNVEKAISDLGSKINEIE
ncbi:hypothetical protein FQR65_LT17155 [Abscondita terminalis]|nr:hypothetical protein FQR65_LT17155 [Abscondita terminalis]